ncbi:MAG: PVC-type heme-binding CxxCH protein [Pirellulales bacterium]
MVTAGFSWRYVLSIGLIVIACCAPAAGAADLKSPLGPQESLAHFQLDQGLRIELVACEPEVIDPIAVRFDEDGRMWVVEMRDYPHGPQQGKPPLSKIRVLTDNDGDGRFESSQTFADELLFPTGLEPWQGGVIVTLAGEVAYLKDADGDGRAEVRETWFRGFATENPQLRANHPRFALDNHIYIANGLRGGTIIDARPTAPGSGPETAKGLSISGRDFRFDPRSDSYEAVSGNGQFGLTFDDFGNRFVCSNRQPMDHVVLENGYLARNPFLAVSGVMATVAAAGEASRVFPLTSAWTTSNLHAGQFTAACGVTIYRGDALGHDYRGNVLICEPTGNLVHREIVTENGVTFASKPAHENKEFLASPDPWFRPVNLEVGPDGALYVVDMYRAVIEHPEFMPSELERRPDLRLGDDRGRIYRIVPADSTKKARRPQLSTASTADLVSLLEHKNAWWRETAARLLYERADPQATPHLERVAKAASEPAARVAALWALAGRGALSSRHVLAALDDRHARVREQAVLLAERSIDDAELRTKVIGLSADGDARVRFRVALAIGGLASNDVVAPLSRIALDRAGDAWTRRAVAAARPEHTAPILLEVLKSGRVAAATHNRPEQLLVRELATIVGSRRDQGDVGRLFEFVCGDNSSHVRACETALLGLAEGLALRGGLVEMVAQLPERAALESQLNAVFDRAALAAIDENLPDDVRERKLELLEHARSDRAARTCLRIVEQSPSQPLRMRAAAALATQRSLDFAPALVAGYPAQTPAVRRAILDALVVQPIAAQKLLEAIQSGRIARAELDGARENRLRKHRDPAVQKRANEILTLTVPADRKDVLAKYQAALALKSDPKSGEALFRQHCAMCHHIGDVGVDVAPDISDSRAKTPQQLLTDILNPNQAIDNNYVSYTIVTSDGNVQTGIIAAETAASITLRQAENKTLAVLRADIEAIQTSGASLMPEGFEKHLSQQQVADLIGFIKNWRYLEQPIPGTIAPEGK